jgi:hypothetical protein
MFKVVSDINKLDVNMESPELSSLCEAEVNKHLYSCEPKCNFMLFCNRGDENIACNGVMNLQMTGKF